MCVRCDAAGCQGSISEKYFTADLPLVRYNTVLNTPCTSPYTGNVNLTCSVSGRFEYSPGCGKLNPESSCIHKNTCHAMLTHTLLLNCADVPRVLWQALWTPVAHVVGVVGADPGF